MRLPPARATTALCVATAVAFAIVTSAGLDGRLPELAGFIPARVSGGLAIAQAVPVALTPLTATLVHGGLLHLAFNLLMLGYCGRFVEASVGPGPLVVLYGVGAYAAAAAQFAMAPGSNMPMVGASGAASAIVAAYALLYGRRRVGRLGARVSAVVQIAWLAAAWIALQALVALAGGTPGLPQAGGAAVAAHVGGFVAGLVLARPLLMVRYRRA